MGDRKRSSGGKGFLEALLEPLVESLGEAVHEAIDRDHFSRDPETVATVRSLLGPFEAWYDPEVRGIENLPASGPFLLVGNHSGGAEPVDFWPFFAHWVDARGPEAPLYGLSYDLLFAAPALGRLLRRLGFVPASQANADKALGMGAPVAVFPGGDYEVFRPWRERNTVDFGGRTGFITTAISRQVPVVPMTIHGAHESTFVITRGRELARLGGLDRLRVKVFPLVVNIPFGVTPAFVPTIQLPSKITVELGRPLDWTRFPPHRSADPEVLRDCYQETMVVMQEAMDRMAAEYPWPVLTRLRALRPDRLLERFLGAGR